MVRNPPAMQKTGFDPWVGKIPGGGHGYPLQYSCLENSIDRGAWQATVHGVTESDMTEDFHFLTSKYQKAQQPCPQISLLFQLYLFLRRFHYYPGFKYLLLLTAKLCPTLCYPMDCSSQGSSVQGIFQARILEWIINPYGLNSKEYPIFIATPTS